MTAETVSSDRTPLEAATGGPPFEGALPRVERAVAEEVERFLYEEAELLDDRRFEDWLALFADDATYEVPLRVAREGQAQTELSERGRMFWDSKETLAIRVQRLRTEYAWAEQPPSRTRHLVTNLRVGRLRDGEIGARCNLLVYRNRGEEPAADLYVGDRRDVLLEKGESFVVKHRWIALDKSNMSGNSMSIFL
jgi:3-phenylpropionate/cinnamic acid dioxygenase small subunit